MDPSWCGRTFIEEVIPVTHVSGKNSRHAIMQDFQQNTDIECVPVVQKQKKLYIEWGTSVKRFDDFMLKSYLIGLNHRKISLELMPFEDQILERRADHSGQIFIHQNLPYTRAPWF